MHLSRGRIAPTFHPRSDFALKTPMTTSLCPGVPRVLFITKSAIPKCQPTRHLCCQRGCRRQAKSSSIQALRSQPFIFSATLVSEKGASGGACGAGCSVLQLRSHLHLKWHPIRYILQCFQQSWVLYSALYRV